MAYQEPTGARKPMAPEAKAKIAEAVRRAAARKREEMGLPPIQSGNSVNSVAPTYIEKPIELVKMRDRKSTRLNSSH